MSAAVAVQTLDPGALRKAIELARRRGFAAIEARISFDDYVGLREANLLGAKWSGFMQQTQDGRWKAFGVLLDFEHPPETTRELTLKFMGLPAPVAPARGLRSFIATAKSEFALGSIHKEPIQ